MRALWGLSSGRWSVLSVWSLGALAVLALAAACGGDEASGSPELPEGFTSAKLLDVPMDLYVFAAQEDPLSLPTDYFIEPGSTWAALAPSSVDVASVTTWLGTGTTSFGASMRLVNDGEADLIAAYLENTDGPWHHRDSGTLTFVEGNDVWASVAQDAVLNGKRVALSEAYPDAWELLQHFPSDPPDPPVAAGFVRLDQGLIESLAERVGVTPTGVTAALNTARVGDLVFAMYQEEVPDLSGGVDLDFLESSGAGALVVTKAGYPGFVVGLAMGVFAGQAGMEEFTLDGEDAYYTALGGLHLVMRNRGNVIFVALAPDRTRAEALISAVSE